MTIQEIFKLMLALHEGREVFYIDGKIFRAQVIKVEEQDCLGEVIPCAIFEDGSRCRLDCCELSDFEIKEN